MPEPRQCFQTVSKSFCPRQSQQIIMKTFLMVRVETQTAGQWRVHFYPVWMFPTTISQTSANIPRIKQKEPSKVSMCDQNVKL